MLSPLHIQIGVQCGTQREAVALSDALDIRGRWNARPIIVFGERKTTELLLDLVNTSALENRAQLDGILYFVKKWGPLMQPWMAGQEFTEPIATWIWHQSLIRNMWRSRGRNAAPSHWPRSDSGQRSGGRERLTKLSPELRMGVSPPEAHVLAVMREADKEWEETWRGLLTPGSERLHPGPQFEFLARGPKANVCSAGVDTIQLFVHVMLLATDARYLRMCWRPDCDTPYFVADDLKAHYCSEDCTRWSRAEHKRQWWKNRGTEWRKSKRKEKA